MPALSLAARAVLALIGVAVIAFVVWWVFVHPGQLKQELAQANTNAGAAKVETQTAQAATKTLERTIERDHYTEKVVHDGQAAVYAAPGASTPISDDVGHAGCDALRVLYNLPGEAPCAGLPFVRPQDTAGPDAGGPAASR